MSTIDQNNLKIQSGKNVPLGCTRSGAGFNFAVYADQSDTFSLILYTDNAQNSMISIPLDPKKNRTGQIWHIEVSGLPECFEYGFQKDHKNHVDPSKKNKNSISFLNDPYARAYSGGENWGEKNRDGSRSTRYRSLYTADNFDWENDQPLNNPLKETIIYELHLRGYTKHRSSHVEAPGTYIGLTNKIPYLKSLGITAVELLPIFEFDEGGNDRINPETGENLYNFWGYDPLGYFAPKAAYSSKPGNGGQINEFKEMVKKMHKAGIEVILDVVFNHTGEGPQDHPIFSYRGLANSTYYMVEKNSGHYLDFTGCGNTVNCNHPVVTKMILDALHYWVKEMHIDGFRFDLVSILTRDADGSVFENPPIIEKINIGIIAVVYLREFAVGINFFEKDVDALKECA